MADMDPYPGLKKKDKEFLESVNLIKIEVI